MLAREGEALLMSKPLTDEQVDRLKTCERKIKEANEEYKREYYSILDEMKCNCQSKLVILYYTKAVTLPLEDGEFWRRYEDKDYAILAYLTHYEIIGKEAIPRFRHVTKDGKEGNCIDMWYLKNVSFEELDDCTIEEARKILKTEKSKKNL